MGQEEFISNDALYPSLQENENRLQSIFSSCSDIVFRTIKIFGSKRCLVVFIDGLIDTNHLDQALLKPMMLLKLESFDSISSFASMLQEEILTIAQITPLTQLQDVVQHVLKGEVVLLFDQEIQALAASVKKWEHRPIAEPSTEPVVRGPREGFNESIRSSTALLRRKIRTSSLKMKPFTVGKESNTDVVVAYIEGIALESVVEEVQNRISRIEMDAVLESGYIEEMIRDAPFSPFPMVQHTERPDVVAGALMEGKIALLVDGTPLVLIVPMTFWSAFQSPEDFYEGFISTTFIRWLRFFFLGVSLLLPSLYVAITTFHQEMIPTSLALSIAASREYTPFPALIEALIMEVTFEALREAGVRLPRPVGQAVSIVGGLVIGQAAVQAGIVSAPMVIVVSVTGIASFIIPRFNMGISIRMLRFPLIFVAGSFGLYGIGAGILAMLIHLVNLRSFGVPYFTPVAPFSWSDLKDVFVRVPWWKMRNRPQFGGILSQERIPTNQKPGPSKND
jgi:spore germination protein KA